MRAQTRGRPSAIEEHDQLAGRISWKNRPSTMSRIVVPQQISPRKFRHVIVWRSPTGCFLLLFIQGANFIPGDQAAGRDFLQETGNALIRARKEYELLLFPDERHMPRGEADRVYMEERILAFLEESLA